MAELITDSKLHKMLNGIELIKRREELGLTQADFAELCGWSRTYQYKLELPDIHEIPTDIAEKIMKIL